MRITPERGFVDHLLAIIACTSASYAIAISVNKQELAVFLAVIVGLSCLAGYGLATTFEGTKLLKADGWLFTIAALVGVGMTRNVNSILPQEGFPFQIIASVILWLIMVGGGLFAWRDGTLLFLSLPGIALFGLVGVINDQVSALGLFCLFLVSVAVLYARVHQRYMLEEAAKSGADTKLLWRDAWRWMAGPEWAFAAVGVVIVLSFMAAPLVQGSLSGVSGNVGRNVQRQVSQAIQQRAQTATNQSDTRIGQGPVSLDETPLFQVKTDTRRYLRSQVFTEYTGQGWNDSEDTSRDTLNMVVGDRRKMTPAIESVARDYEGVREVDYELLIRTSPTQTKVFAPGLIIEAPDRGRYSQKDAITNFGYTEVGETLYRFRSLVTDLDAMPDPFDDGSARIYTSPQQIPGSVATLANEVTQGTSDPFEKAQRLKSEIERRTKYNISAPATPSGVDPVEHFLFDQQEGYCDVFASSMVLMARSIGLPARYTIGYIINDPVPDEEGFFTIRGKDYHAWAEVYFPEHGWVPFDATEGAEQVEGSERGESISQFQIFLNNIPWSQVMTGVGVVAALAVALVFTLRARSMEPRIQAGTRGEVLQLQNRFQKGLESYLKHPRRFSQTIREFVGGAENKLGDLGGQAQKLAHAYESGMFGKTELDKEAVKSLRQETKDFLAALKKIPRSKA